MDAEEGSLNPEELGKFIGLLRQCGEKWSSRFEMTCQMGVILFYLVKGSMLCPP